MSKSLDIVTIGEAMLRLSPPAFQRLAQATTLDMQVGGAESNVAINLAQLGFRTAWLSRLPDNPLGHWVASVITRHGVDTGGVCFVAGERLGLYFIELATSPRPNRVIYDRAHSAASRMTFADLDTARITASRWLHMTGITPALSEHCRRLTLEALQFARAHGVITSLDVNYRALLWSPDEAAEALKPLLALCDYAFLAHRDAVTLFGAPADADAAAGMLRDQLGCGCLVMTCGEARAIACTAQARFSVEQPFKVSQVVDRIGAGDAFDAGFIAARLLDHPLDEALRWGHALSALKLTIPGDLALVRREELLQLLQEQGGGFLPSVR